MIHPHIPPAIPLAHHRCGVERLPWAKRADKFGAVPLLGLPVALARGACSLIVLATSITALAIARFPPLTHTTREALCARWRIIALHASLEGERALHELIPGLAKKRWNFDIYFAWRMSLELVKKASPTELLASELQAFSQLCTSHTTRRSTDHPLLIASKNGLWSVCFLLIQNGIKMEGEAHQQIVEQTLAMRRPSSNTTNPTKDLVTENLMDMELRNLEQTRVAGAVIDPLRIRNLLHILQSEIDTTDQAHGFPHTKIFLNHAPVEVMISVLQSEVSLLDRIYACKQELLPLLLSRCTSAELGPIQEALYLAMVRACQDNDLLTARVLLGNGLSVNNDPYRLANCLRDACLAEQVSLVKLLIDLGVDPLLACEKGEHDLPLVNMLCKRPFKKDIVVLILQESPAGIYSLINRTPNCRSALWTLMEDLDVLSPSEQKDQIEIARHLLDKGARLTEVYDDLSILQLACRAANPTLFPSLLAHPWFATTHTAMPLLLQTCQEPRWQDADVQAAFKLIYLTIAFQADSNNCILKAYASGATDAFIDTLINAGNRFFDSHPMTAEEQKLMRQICRAQSNEFYQRHTASSIQERSRYFLPLFESLAKLFLSFYGMYEPETPVRSIAFVQTLQRLAAMSYEQFSLLGCQLLETANVNFFRVPYFQSGQTHYLQRAALNAHAHIIISNLLLRDSRDRRVYFLKNDYQIIISSSIEMSTYEEIRAFLVQHRLVAHCFDNGPQRPILMKNGIPTIRRGRKNLDFCTGPLYSLLSNLSAGDPLHTQLTPLLPPGYLEMLNQLPAPREGVGRADSYRPLLETFVMCCGDDNEKATIKNASDEEIIRLLTKYNDEVAFALSLRKRH